MDNGLWVGLLSAFSALAGAAIAQWGALRAAALHARHQAGRDTLQRSRALLDQRAALLARKREEFLGYVLLAQNRMLDVLARYPESDPCTAADKPSSAARQAYAVALLYLADMLPLAKAFYAATTKLQTALERDGGDALASEQAGAWNKSFAEIEVALAAEYPDPK